jgi:hypothetical protein
MIAQNGPDAAALGSLPDTLEPLRADIEAYFAGLPGLIAEGQEGRFALVQGGKVHSTWATFEDAYQAGRSQFGLGPFLAQPITRQHAARVVPPIHSRPAVGQP